MSPFELTPQQQAVVDHDHGPALVFAVAGAGKTTALEHRIARMVREGVFAPERILAVAYNRDVKLELERRLMQHDGCNRVQVYTLHAFALRAVRMAAQQGQLPLLAPDAFTRFDRADSDILNMALREARNQNVAYRSELDALDRNDFLTWVAAAKGNLLYPDLGTVDRSIRRTRLARQAEKPRQNPWYLDFYRLFEKVRRGLGLLTFDDQLLTGWEVLVSHESILHSLQQQFDCVLVDEYQDVNLAQADMLDRLVAPHQNLMVIGDDDQTIYEWRGADPQFILGFEQRYNATRYYMTENFRCKLGPVLLANDVIKHNRKRAKKALQLTQGVDGTTRIQKMANASEMGAAIAATVRAQVRAGLKRSDIAILVRAYAQTPPVEQGLIVQDIPYEIVNSKPFYLRHEVQTLVDYCRLAFVERQICTQGAMTARQVEQIEQLWRKVYWQPKRYISGELSDRILETVRVQQRPLAQVLCSEGLTDSARVQRRLRELGETLEWLTSALPPGDKSNRSAHSILGELDRRLGYIKYLEERSEISETGADEAETVRQFIAYANERGNLHAFLTHVNQLEGERDEDRRETHGDAVTIRSIHTAKGLEWPVVIIPSCNDGNMPHRKSDNHEEERRLLYVALTRSKRDLYIYHFGDDPSSFLCQAQYRLLLQAGELIRSALAKAPEAWTPHEVQALAVAAPRLRLRGYFEQWHHWSPDYRLKFANSLVTIYQELVLLGLTSKFKISQKTIAFWRRLAGPDAPAESVRLAGLDRWLQRYKKRAPATGSKPGLRPTRPSARPPSRPHAGWRVGDQVEHPIHGTGTITKLIWIGSAMNFIKAEFKGIVKTVHLLDSGIRNLSRG